jgi:hypothetical protein
LAQFIFQIAISLSDGGAYFIIKIRREFLQAVNIPAMFQNLFKEFGFCLRTSRKSTLRPKIFAANHFVHVKTPFLIITIIIILLDSRRIHGAAVGGPETMYFSPPFFHELASERKMDYN